MKFIIHQTSQPDLSSMDPLILLDMQITIDLAFMPHPGMRMKIDQGEYLTVNHLTHSTQFPDQIDVITEPGTEIDLLPSYATLLAAGWTKSDLDAEPAPRKGKPLDASGNLTDAGAAALLETVSDD